MEVYKFNNGSETYYISAYTKEDAIEKFEYQCKNYFHKDPKDYKLIEKE